jgi:predicted signal transduction protein with EAL and GGDEF domain
LAEELDTDLIAEGVENSEQARFLLSAGCKFAQGYYFSRPVDAAQTTGLLRERFISPPLLHENPKDTGGRLSLEKKAGLAS